MKTELLLAAFVVGVATGCGGPQDPVVMRYGSTTVTADELLHEARSGRYQGLSPEQQADFALRQLLMMAYLVADPVDDAERELLQRRNARRASHRCLTVKLKQRVAASPVDLEREAEDYFETHRDEFSVPDRFILDLIFIPAEDQGSEALAQDIFSQVDDDPGRFAELAREHSRSETAAAGGRTQPIPGSAVHPEVRRAVALNSGTNRPFLVTIDRGHYILRVVQFWPEIPAEFDQVRDQVVESVRRQAMDRLYREALESVSEDSEIEVRDHLLLSPRVPWDEAVVAFDREWYSVRDILPGVEVGGTVPGPVLAKEIEAFHRWAVSSRYYGCPEPVDPEIGDAEVAAGRLDHALREYASRDLGDDIRRYHSVHAAALVTLPVFTFDLYVFPIVGSDPFAEHQRYADLMAALQSGEGVDGNRIEDAGVSVFTDVVMTDVEAARYDRILLGVLSELAEGAVSAPRKAAGVRAWIMVRLDHIEGPRPLDPDDLADRTTIADHYVEDSRERVVESLYEAIRRDAVIDEAVLAQCEATLRDNVEHHRGE